MNVKIKNGDFSLEAKEEEQDKRGHGSIIQ
jgi:hypothetical protein